MFADSTFIGTSVKTVPRGTRFCCKYFASRKSGFDEKCAAWLEKMKENDGSLDLYDFCRLAHSAQNSYFSGIVDGFRNMAKWFAKNLPTINFTVKDLKDAHDWVLSAVWSPVEDLLWKQTYTPLLKVEPIRVEPEVWKCWYGLSEYGDGLYDFCRTHGEYLEIVEEEIPTVNDQSERLDEARTRTWAIFTTTLRYILAFVLAVLGLAVIHSVMEETSSK